MTPILTPHDVDRAAEVLKGVARRTPIVTCQALDERTGARVFSKAENFQRTGSFKFRGAYNAIAALPPESRRAGVCTVSSGNHGQAVALAAKLLSTPAVVVMPHDAPPIKRAAVEGYGAEVVPFDRQSVPQWLAGDRVREERGLPLISSHDHPLISAGAGTAMLELLQDAGPIDCLFAPVGGGGGFAGYATALCSRNPDARVVAVEPAASGLLAATLAAGERVERPVPDTIADGLRLTRIGVLPLDVIRETVSDVIGVTDAEIVAAMTFAFERMKVVLEPSGAVALAGLLSGQTDVAGRRVAVIMSGGNIDAGYFAALVSGS